MLSQIVYYLDKLISGLITLFDSYFFSFLDDGKKAECSPLAPVEVKILISWGSAYKIVTENGTMLIKKPDVSAPKSIIDPSLLNSLSFFSIKI